VYLTTITLAGTNEWLKPGMSAKVEVLVNHLADIVYVPVQAVSMSDGKQVCFVRNGASYNKRAVETGEFNDEFIEIKSGVKPGDLVLLRPISSPESQRKDQAPPATPESKPQPEPAKPAAVAAKT
jgi:HlyD family secretion protein